VIAMNIGFDAKRAYHNTTGLGHFSRTLIGLLAGHYPAHNYYLFNPTRSSKFEIKGATVHQVLPSRFIDRIFPSAWRSSWVKSDLKRLGINIYHGVSHEIPIGIRRTGIRSVVTIHDLIHERHPEHYNPIDVKIYRKKFRYACRHADRIMAISGQTKKDIIEFYGVPAEKISVCYQSCEPVFSIPATAEEKLQVRQKYDLPASYFLYVGAITERKNLLGISKAMKLLKDKTVPLLVLGNGGKYKQSVKEFIKKNELEKRVIFLYEKLESAGRPPFIPLEDLPEIYQSAIGLVYPSFFEGFGAPVLEALWSRLPVITSNTSCLPEVGGPGSLYVDPANPEEIAGAMQRLIDDPAQAHMMGETGLNHAAKFSPGQYVDSVMNLYQSLC
jgi:glycosyltransferase involved in cell wall biosynthesis